MLKMYKKTHKNNKGFTLVELIVVIAIIGVLSAVLIPRFTGFTDDAKKKSVESEARVIAKAMSIYYAEKGSWPTASQLNDERYLRKGTYDSTNKTLTVSGGTLTITESNNTPTGGFTYSKNGFTATYDPNTDTVTVTP